MSVKPAKTFNNYLGLHGDRALIAAVIAVAVDDSLCRGNPRPDRADVASGRQYMANGTYDYDLALLGLPADWLPGEFENGKS